MDEQQLPWDPFNHVNQMRQNLNSFFNSMPMLPWSNNLADLHPSVDIYQTETDVIASIEVPGVDPEDIDITVMNDRLIVKGEISRNQEIKEEGYYRSERKTGKFQRILPLPADIKANGSKASFQNGVLEVKMPKQVRKYNQGYKPKIEH